MSNRNRLILQGFEWHTASTPPSPGETHSPTSHYARLTRLLPSLATLGVTDLWLPPGCKANNPHGNGYDVYDLWDLGEFGQKGARCTKWGSREELSDLLSKGKECGVEMIWDAVLNHKAGGDGTEECWAVEVDEADRRYEVASPEKIEAWLRFDFPGRERDGQLANSQFRWRPEHFNGVDWNQRTQAKAIYKLIDEPSGDDSLFKPPKRPLLGRQRTSSRYRRLLSARSSSFASSPLQRPGKGWAEDVDKEHGNNDYLMFCNIDYTHKEVRQDVVSWGRWMVEGVGIDGFRLDAVQHFSFSFTRDWIQSVQQASTTKNRKEAFLVGEVWTGDRRRITSWLDAVQSDANPQVFAFDSPLVYNFSRISEASAKRKADLRTLLHGSLLEARPEAAVTLVTNHDTQPGQTSYTPISPFLKPLFYAYILLRRSGLPCVFWGDLFGTNGPHAEKPISVTNGRPSLLADLMLCRQLLANGEQVDYVFDSRDCVAWTRSGTKERPNGCAILMSVGNKSKTFHSIRMGLGAPGEVWVDVLRQCEKEVVIDADGQGAFLCHAMSVSVWMKKDAPERQRFPVKLGAASF